MTQRLTKFVARLVSGGETDLGELYKLCLDQTASWKPRPEPEAMEKVITIYNWKNGPGYGVCDCVQDITEWHIGSMTFF